jgi:hypothetical protein
MQGFELFEGGSNFTESDEGYFAIWQGKKITKEEYDELCKEINVSEIEEIK